jgi:hypothetical protein
MPPVNYGTQTKSATTPSEYSDAQYAALEGVKQRTPALKFGAARPEFANKIMLVDGTISDNLDAVRAALPAAEQKDRAAFAAFKQQHADAVLNDTIAPELMAQFVTLRDLARHSRIDEFEDHVGQARFLFIVDADLVPRIYFQSAVPGNPDVELA